MATEPWVVDTDNGLGGNRGDVDDGFALTALQLAGVPLRAVTTVFGNTRESCAWENTRGWAEELGYRGPLARGASRRGPGMTDASALLASQFAEAAVLALGPLTNVAQALSDADTSPREIVMVGGNASSRGRWPPLWPFEFNFTHDRWACRRVWESEAPLTVIPLDVCGRLRRPWTDIDRLPGRAGNVLKTHSRRWWRRAARRGMQHVPVWDLVAAIYVISPELFTVGEAPVELTRRGATRWNRGSRSVRWIQDFEPDAVWDRFVTLLATG